MDVQPAHSNVAPTQQLLYPDAPVAFGTTTAAAPALVYPAADIGGTNLRVLMVGPNLEVIARVHKPTPKGAAALLAALKAAIDEAAQLAGAKGYAIAPVLSIGTPGRFELDASGARVMAPRTAGNLESFPGELAGFNLQRALAETLSLDESRVFLDNDAIVQARHTILELLKDPRAAAQLYGETVVSLNPGTGLGGSVAFVGRDGKIENFTDGHLSE